MNHLEFAKRNSKIKQLALNHNTPEEIAELLNMNPDRVRQIIRSFRIKPYRHSQLDKGKTAQAIIKELESGTMQNDIARKLNISRQYVSQVKLRYEESKMESKDV